MEFRHLGSSGLRVSALSFGSWVTFGDQVDEEVAYACMKASLDAGVNFFDNAEAYARGQSETMMGKVLRKGGWKRSDLVISTKIFWGGEGPNDQGLSAKHIREGTDAALKRLQLDYVDLIFCHRPDLHTPIEETVRAMSLVIQQGKALYWGTSEWSGEQIRHAYEIARREHLVPPTMEQPQYNMFHRDKVEVEFGQIYRTVGLGTTIWSPLASGILTGKHRDIKAAKGTRLTMEGLDWLRERELTPERLKTVEKLNRIADGLGLSLPVMALAWCLKNPNVSTVILGASKEAQLKENLKASDAQDLLTPAVMEKIEKVLGNAPVRPQW